MRTSLPAADSGICGSESHVNRGRQPKAAKMATPLRGDAIICTGQHTLLNGPQLCLFFERPAAVLACSRI